MTSKNRNDALCSMSRSSRIKILLAIDVVFFFVEIISGYAVGSLALVADSFHMLNDVMSLIVALYAIKLTNQSATDSRYSYGWHRAEILAALINGVFLVALCFSIGLEAMERFFSTPEISNPKLVIIVGSFGLASNLVGLFLFHEHGHSHGHSHSHSHSLSHEDSGSHAHAHDAVGPAIKGASAAADGEESTSGSDSEEEQMYSAVGPGHPVMTRASIVRVAHNMARTQSPAALSRSYDDHGHSHIHSSHPQTETTPLLANADPSSSSLTRTGTPILIPPQPPSPLLLPLPPMATHTVHGGHSHAGSMNMRALVLHVLGDALGNVGVIATGCIILLAPASWGGREVYFDPAISLVIAFIILGSAVTVGWPKDTWAWVKPEEEKQAELGPGPSSGCRLVTKPELASRLLARMSSSRTGVPSTISLEQVRAAILAVEGVQSLHELHIWQLSESKNIASVHVLASRELDFMPIAAKIRKALHDHGIHSCTIQPEYYGSRWSERAGGSSPDTACLVLCPPEECNPQEDACCRACLFLPPPLLVFYFSFVLTMLLVAPPPVDV
ncbi:cation efflux family-domain-containing protein [Mycena olivaceomarginata]|nr:cation efflux family-domain-containing protein [Mycena olivaceomarginata]